MNYSKEEFFDLMERAEEQSCVHLDDVCGPREYDFIGPHASNITLDGCGNSSLFEIPYHNVKNEEATVVLCAVDDDLGKMPRFGGDRFGKD